MTRSGHHYGARTPVGWFGVIIKTSRGSKMAHTVFAVAMALGCLAFSLPAAGADAAAWCAVIKGGEYWDCQYRSLEDCWPNVLGSRVV